MLPTSFEMLRVLLLFAVLSLSVSALRVGGAVPRVQPRVSKITAQEEPNYAELATTAIDNMIRMLGDMEPPAAVRDLKAAVAAEDVDAIQTGMYDMLITQALDYQVQEDGTLTKNKFDFSDLSVDEDSKKETMRYVYSCACAPCVHNRDHALRPGSILALYSCPRRGLSTAHDNTSTRRPSTGRWNHHVHAWDDQDGATAGARSHKARGQGWHGRTGAPRQRN